MFSKRNELVALPPGYTFSPPLRCRILLNNHKFTRCFFSYFIIIIHLFIFFFYIYMLSYNWVLWELQIYFK